MSGLQANINGTISILKTTSVEAKLKLAKTIRYCILALCSATQVTRRNGLCHLKCHCSLRKSPLGLDATRKKTLNHFSNHQSDESEELSVLDAEDEEDESSDSADSAAGRPLDSPDTEDLELLSLALDFFLFRIRGLAFALAWSFGEAFAFFFGRALAAASVSEAAPSSASNSASVRTWSAGGGAGNSASLRERSSAGKTSSSLMRSAA
jgi:hypothetical protein